MTDIRPRTEQQIEIWRTPIVVVRYEGERSSDPRRPLCEHCASVFDRPKAIAAAWRGDVLINAWCRYHFTHRDEGDDST